MSVMRSIVCDECGDTDDAPSTDTSKALRQGLKEAGWWHHQRKDFCPSCWDFPTCHHCDGTGVEPGYSCAVCEVCGDE